MERRGHTLIGNCNIAGYREYSWHSKGADTAREREGKHKHSESDPDTSKNEYFSFIPEGVFLRLVGRSNHNEQHCCDRTYQWKCNKI